MDKIRITTPEEKERDAKLNKAWFVFLCPVLIILFLCTVFLNFYHTSPRVFGDQRDYRRAEITVELYTDNSPQYASYEKAFRKLEAEFQASAIAHDQNSNNYRKNGITITFQIINVNEHPNYIRLDEKDLRNDKVGVIPTTRVAYRWVEGDGSFIAGGTSSHGNAKWQILKTIGGAQEYLLNHHPLHGAPKPLPLLRNKP